MFSPLPVFCIHRYIYIFLAFVYFPVFNLVVSFTRLPNVSSVRPSLIYFDRVSVGIISIVLVVVLVAHLFFSLSRFVLSVHVAFLLFSLSYLDLSRANCSACRSFFFSLSLSVHCPLSKSFLYAYITIIIIIIIITMMMMIISRNYALPFMYHIFVHK